ncbi:MAG TPA: regulatory iron-sulfur-containing complex subunit RicT [Candidatus Cloacimonadota bacterium]|nr:regulatory iron-sulfur-containing complex subunit RicT [Candidatus Cloacimonadota bacterium]
MQEYVELVFRSERTGYFINNKQLPLEPDMKVIARVERGEDIGTVLNCAVSEEELAGIPEVGEINKISRIATEEDLKQLEIVEQKEQEAREKFLKMLNKYTFEMKLLDTCYQLDGNKLTFFFSADGRIDFRDFVRELATEFKTRIELHQTSGREDARRYGGYGICGKTYCCCSFLRKFNQVTIQMAKDQNLLSNLSKISGPCGRLLCCLHFEEDFYLAQSEGFPNLEEMIIYNDKKMYVLKNDYYNNKVNLISEDEERETITLEEYKKLKKNNAKPRS